MLEKVRNEVSRQLELLIKRLSWCSQEDAEKTMRALVSLYFMAVYFRLENGDLTAWAYRMAGIEETQGDLRYWVTRRDHLQQFCRDGCFSRFMENSEEFVKLYYRRNIFLPPNKPRRYADLVESKEEKRYIGIYSLHYPMMIAEKPENTNRIMEDGIRLLFFYLFIKYHDLNKVGEEFERIGEIDSKKKVMLRKIFSDESMRLLQ